MLHPTHHKKGLKITLSTSKYAQKRSDTEGIPRLARHKPMRLASAQKPRKSIKVHATKRGYKKVSEFFTREWANSDIEHFGKALKWTGHRQCIAAYEEQKIVGMMGLDTTEGVMYIESLVVAPDQRRRGVGKKLIKKAESIARASHAHKIFLETGIHWPALKFYKSLGFKVTGKTMNHYSHHDFVELTKFL